MPALSLPPEQAAKFRNHAANLVRLDVGTLLYRFNQGIALEARDGGIKDYWSLVLPRTPEDPGLGGAQGRAIAAGASLRDFARARAAVAKQWNAMDTLIVVRLLVESDAYYGQASSQRADLERQPNVLLIGGGWQVWIPGLSRLDIEVREAVPVR